MVACGCPLMVVFFLSSILPSSASLFYPVALIHHLIHSSLLISRPCDDILIIRGDVAAQDRRGLLGLEREGERGKEIRVGGEGGRGKMGTWERKMKGGRKSRNRKRCRERKGEERMKEGERERRE